MTLKPWYTVVSPREDLRLGKPLDAAEFAVHLDQIRDDRAPNDYQNPAQFFARTYLTQNLLSLAIEVVRRLSGEKTESSAVFNLATQFGGGKTHALTMLYHMAQNGPKGHNWSGVDRILTGSGVANIPEAAVAVFVGTEFDSLTGRGGHDGTPLRKTPWGEIAYQLGGETALAVVAEHEKHFIEPKGDVIRAFLPKDRPCLILLDEIINYVSTYRRLGYHNAFYNFIQALSEVARGENNVVLVVSIPASELEYTSEDEADEQRFKKVLDRLGKAFIVSAKSETSEIIRRRLFEWHGLPDESRKVINAYANWVVDHRYQLPSWFPVDNPQEAFEATYPFHPMVLSVFERKWQTLPRFQQTRGILRLLALWVSKIYDVGYKERHRDPLIGLGTAPLDDTLFRAAIFEQLGDSRMESVVTTDICGKPDAHAFRLDKNAVDTIKKACLHQKVATAIFFESNGGNVRPEATLPELRLAVSDPDLDIGNVETVLETLTTSAYYLDVQANRYHFSPSPNLNKIYADRRATIQPAKIEERVQKEIRDIFKAKASLELFVFPERSNDIPDRAILTLVVLLPHQSMQDPTTIKLVEVMTREYGSQARIFKNALVWAIAEDDKPLREAARKLLAWQKIDLEEADLRLNDSQLHQLSINLKKAKSELTESTWRAYKRVALLGKDNAIRVLDLGLLHSSSADSMITLILNRLHQDGDVNDTISPAFLVRNWPPAFKEWSIKSVREAFFASPQFPRLLNPDMAIRGTIAKGVTEGLLAYIGKTADEQYEPFDYKRLFGQADVQITDELFIVTRETAEVYLESRNKPQLPIDEPQAGEDHKVKAEIDPYTTGDLSNNTTTTSIPVDKSEPVIREAGVSYKTISNLRWSGRVPWQKLGNLYMRVLSKFTSDHELNIEVRVNISGGKGISLQKVEEMKAMLQELELNDDIETNT